MLSSADCQLMAEGLEQFIGNP